jgi:hypothetical protein
MRKAAKAAASRATAAASAAVAATHFAADGVSAAGKGSISAASTAASKVTPTVQWQSGGGDDVRARLVTLARQRALEEVDAFLAAQGFPGAGASVAPVFDAAEYAPEEWLPTLKDLEASGDMAQFLMASISEAEQAAAVGGGNAAGIVLGALSTRVRSRRASAPVAKALLAEARQLAGLAAAAVYGAGAEEQRLLRRLWLAAGAGAAEEEPRWTELGFQNSEPTSDFRGGGLLALAALVEIAEASELELRAILQAELRRPDGHRCPVALVAIHLSRALAALLHLEPAALSGDGPVEEEWRLLLPAALAAPETAAAAAAEVQLADEVAGAEETWWASAPLATPAPVPPPCPTRPAVVPGAFESGSRFGLLLWEALRAFCRLWLEQHAAVGPDFEALVDQVAASLRERLLKHGSRTTGGGLGAEALRAWADGVPAVVDRKKATAEAGRELLALRAERADWAAELAYVRAELRAVQNELGAAKKHLGYV